MTGRGFGRIVRNRSPSQHKPRSSPQKRKSRPGVDVSPSSIIEKFQKLTISVTDGKHAQPVSVDLDRKVKVLLFQQRQFLRVTKDFHHLNEHGVIKDKILDTRKAFLKKHGMLENEFQYLGRTVYGNYHLYDINQIDTLGLSNLQRMEKGLCPIDKSGKGVIIIHHFDQTMAGPWVVLLDDFHREHSTSLHSEVQLFGKVNKSEFSIERKNYWKYQAQRMKEESQPESDILHSSKYKF